MKCCTDYKEKLRGFMNRAKQLEGLFYPNSKGDHELGVGI